MVKILNKCKYNNLILMNDDLHGFTGFFKNEILNDKIAKVVILENNTKGLSFPSVVSGSIVSAITSGAASVIGAALMSKKKFDVTLGIYLKDGEYIEINTNDRDLLRFLLQYM